MDPFYFSFGQFYNYYPNMVINANGTVFIIDAGDYNVTQVLYAFTSEGQFISQYIFSHNGIIAQLVLGPSGKLYLFNYGIFYVFDVIQNDLQLLFNFSVGFLEAITINVIEDGNEIYITAESDLSYYYRANITAIDKNVIQISSSNKKSSSKLKSINDNTLAIILGVSIGGVTVVTGFVVLLLFKKNRKSTKGDPEVFIPETIEINQKKPTFITTN